MSEPKRQRLRHSRQNSPKPTAPFDGTISAKYVENFQTAHAGQVICRLLDTSAQVLQ
jgi:hypothetical protein